MRKYNTGRIATAETRIIRIISIVLDMVSKHKQLLNPALKETEADRLKREILLDVGIVSVLIDQLTEKVN